MTWATELQKIRTYLRDPKGNIWSEGLLRDLWNEVQSDLQNKTNMLEDMASISVPPRYQVSYTHDWETQFIGAGETAYRCFRTHGNHFSFCCRFEAQVAAGIGTDAVDEGATVTHPWEAWVHTDVGHEIPFPLPRNFSSMKWISHDRDPISVTSRRQVMNTGGSWVTHTSTKPSNYYPLDDIENQIVLWPRPSTADWRDTVTLISGTIDDEGGTAILAEDGAAIGLY